MMHYEFLKHTADVRMKVIADSLEELMKVSVLGLAELISHQDNPPNEFSIKHQIHISAPDRTALLIDFLWVL